MSSDAPEARVGVVGLGVMGLGIAKRLVAAGLHVTGYDLSVSRRELLAELGGEPAATPFGVLRASPLVLTCLPSASALRAVVGGPDGLLSGEVPAGRMVVEASTLGLDDKLWARDELRLAGVMLVDSPISGTEIQLEAGTAILYASGEAEAVAVATAALAPAFGSVVDVGGFGNGTKVKLIANHLVAIHNLAAAEALLLAERAGLDPTTVLEALVSGAGSSRMLEVRGPMMAAGRYEPAQMSVGLFHKDLDLIAGFASAVGVRPELFDAARLAYARALADGLGDSDTASLFSLLRREADSATQ
ncbi:putative 3-hydroxyisobutyrate dehydrogenase [metagenome]|uniref:Putative 3-hydroxyisobutyrate dehydrogenase n=1 Tax=metagenome TaxID=256318 RepID=A0A2P2C499_9ZZZZ